MSEYTLESFINFCDDYQIATESFSSIKSKLITGFSRLILWIESKVKKMKDDKIKSTLKKLLNRAKVGLSKSKSLNEHNPEMVKKLQEEMSEIKEECDKCDDSSTTKKEITDEFKNACDNNKKLRVRIMLKDCILIDVNNPKLLSKYLSYANSHVKDLWDEDDGETTEDFNLLMTSMVNNFSKEKWKKCVQLANKRYERK